MPGEAMSVSLSRPATAAAPSSSPSDTPGLLAAGADRIASTIRAVSSRNAATSRPITAAGTSPNGDSAE